MASLQDDIDDEDLVESRIPPEKRGEFAEKVFAKHCTPGSHELTPQEYTKAMAELGVKNFKANRTGKHNIFTSDTAAITRTAHGSLRFARTKTRHCRDVPCLVLFLCYWAAMIGVGSFGFARGDPWRLLYATNYKGEVCGIGNNSDKRLIFYPELDQDLVRFAERAALGGGKVSIQQFESAGECVKKCPRKGQVFTMANISYPVYFNQSEVMMRCFSKYPKSPLYFAKCKAFEPNATTLAAQLQESSKKSFALSQPQLIEGTCKRYTQEWEAPFHQLCLNLTNTNTSAGDWVPIVCLTNKAPCNSLFDSLYDINECCDAAMQTVVPRCKMLTLGKGYYFDNPLLDNPIFQQLIETGSATARAMNDVTISTTLILLCGGLYTVFVSVVWVGLLQIMVRPMVIMTVIAVVLMPLLLAIVCLSRSGFFDGNTQWNDMLDEYDLKYVKSPSKAINPGIATLEQELQAYRYCGYFFAVLFLMTYMMVSSLRPYIRCAIGIFKEATRALKRMPLMIVYPAFPVAMIFLLCLYFLAAGAYIASIDLINQDDKRLNNTKPLGANATFAEKAFRDNMYFSLNTSGLSSMEFLREHNLTGVHSFTFTPSGQISFVLWFHLLGFLWSMESINGIWCCTIAGAVCRWYWKFQVIKDHKEFEHMITWMSFKKTLRYFLGSVVQGSLFISLLQLSRLLFEYAAHSISYFLQKPKLERLGKPVMCVINCIRALLLSAIRAMETMNIGAYIMVVMQGCHFCVGAREGRKLMALHAKLILTCEIMTMVVLAMVRITIVGGSVLLLFACLSINKPLPTMGLLGFVGPWNVSSPVAPMIVCGLFSLAVSNCYVDIIHVTVHSMLLSYAADRELNDETGCYAMTTTLKNFITGKDNKPFKHLHKRIANDDVDDMEQEERSLADAQLDLRTDGSHGDSRKVVV